MPLYFYTFGNKQPVRDSEGVEHPDDARAIEEGQSTLWQIAGNEMTDVKGEQKVSLIITDAQGHPVYAETITRAGMHLR